MLSYRSITTSINRKILIWAKSAETKESSTNSFCHFKDANVGTLDFAFIQETAISNAPIPKK